MKEIVVSRNSWHYRLVEKICIQRNDDICGYTRDVAWSLFVLCVGVAVVCGVVASFADMLAWIAAMIATMQWIHPDEPAVIAAILVFIVVAISLLFVLIVTARQRASKLGKNQSFAVQAFLAWKNKWCWKITVKD